MFSSSVLREADVALRAQAACFDASLLTGPDAAAVVALLTGIERSVVAMRVHAVARVEATRAFAVEGHRDAVSWLSSKSGLSKGDAVAAVQTARQLSSLPEVDLAFRSGSLSVAQASAVARAASVAPEQESQLLSSVAVKSVEQLKERARRMESSQARDGEVQEKRRRSQYLRTWTDVDGMVGLSGRLLPENAAEFKAAFDAFRDQVFREARRAGRRDVGGVYDAEALASMSRAAVSGEGCFTKTKAVVNVRVDYSALQRGFAEPGEVCEIDGVGSVPVTTAKAWLEDCVLQVVLKDGERTIDGLSMGSTIKPLVRRQVRERDQGCVRPKCGSPQNLEIHHYKVPVEHGGPGALWNLATLCRWDHYLVTHKGYELTGEPGAWVWRGPDG